MIFVDAALSKFFTFQGQQVTFDRGLTVLVGPNGAGKTALGLEAACWTLWGKTARGADPVPDGEVTFSVVVGGKTAVVTRRREGGRLADLQLLVDGVTRSGQTPTETQARIDAVVGDWRLFSSTRVFSRAMLARFSTSPNRERGKLLESVLGLERFTRAEKESRGALAIRKATSVVADNRLREAQAVLARSQEAAATSTPAVDLTALRVRLKQVEGQEARQDAKVKELGGRHNRQSALVSVAHATVLNLRGGVDAQVRLVEAYQRRKPQVAGAPCPTCARPMTAEDAAAAAAEYQAGLDEATEFLRQKSALYAAAVAEYEDQLEVQRDLAKKAQGPWEPFSEELKKLRGEMARAEGAAAQAARLQKMLEIDTKRVSGAELEAAKATRDLRVAEAACEALGPRGARVRVFAGAMGAVNAEIRKVMAKLGLDVVVRVVGAKQKANGEVSDEVSVEVTGAGGGAYSGASDGERARIDVAILLALARVAGAGGVLVFDEVFDPLDDEGVERVAELLQEMARERQVLVTSHNPRLTALVPQALTWRVEKVDGVSKVAVAGG